MSKSSARPICKPLIQKLIAVRKTCRIGFSIILSNGKDTEIVSANTVVISLNLIKINNIVAMKMGKSLFDIGIWYTHGRDSLPALRRRIRA